MVTVSPQVQNQTKSLDQELRERALSIYIDTLGGKTLKDLEEDKKLVDFVTEYQQKWGFHLHIKNRNELDPCDGHHAHGNEESSEDQGIKQHSEEEIKSIHSEQEHSHNHSEAEDKPKGFLESIIDKIGTDDSIPKAAKPLLIRFTINSANIFLAQGLSAPLHQVHAPTEITSSSAVTVMHMMNYGSKKWESLAKNLLTIVPFVALHRFIKVPSFVMRSALGFAISLTEQLSNGDQNKSTGEKFKDTFTKDSSKFLFKVAQMEAMLNTAIPLGQNIAKKIPNKVMAFIAQNLAMVASFTVIPELFNLFKPDSAKSKAKDSDAAALTAELLECPVCGDAHGANVHLAEISEGISAAGASNASNHEHLHSILHDHGGVMT